MMILLGYMTHYLHLNGKKAFLILPTLRAFHNTYLVFDRNKICNTMDYLSSTGYERIQEGNAMEYLTFTNIREGCEFGVTSNTPTISFKFR